MKNNEYEDRTAEEQIKMIQNETYPALTDWKKEPTQADLWKDKISADSSHSTFLAKLEKYLLDFNGGKEINARAGKSRVRPKLIRKNWEWKKPSLEEPFLNNQDMFDVKPRTFDDKESSIINKELLNYYWATKVDRVTLVGTIIDRFGIEGTVFVKTGWNSEYRDVEVEVEKPIYGTPEESLMALNESVASGEMDEATAQAMMETGEPVQVGVEKIIEVQSKLIENHPTYEVCDNTCLRVDPTCNGLIEDAQFIIHDYEIDMNTLMRNKYKEETGSGMYKNLDYIDFDADNSSYDEYSNDNSASFIFCDKARKKIKVFEYWGYWDIDGSGTTTPIVATWIGNVMVRLEENPFPHGELPFSCGKYLPVKNEIYGEPDGSLLVDNQESVGKMTRAAHDITSNQAIGQTLINEQFFSSPSQWDAYKKGNDARFRADMDPRIAIHKLGTESVNNSVFQMIDLQQREAESLTGVKSFSSGIGGQALGNTATGIRSALDATSKRELSILRRLSDNLFRDMARKTIINMQVFADDEQVIRITNGELKRVKKEDLVGEFDLIVDVSTPEKDNDTAEKLMKMLQTNQANMDPGLQKLFYGDLLRLWKMPAAAKKIEEFQPQKDPVQEEIKMLQLENAKLENHKLKMQTAKMAKDIEEADGRLAERESRARENNIDMINKEAQAEERKARAELLKEQADNLALEFVKEKGGVNRQREVDDMEYKAAIHREKQFQAQQAKIEEKMSQNQRRMDSLHNMSAPTDKGMDSRITPPESDYNVLGDYN